MAGVARRLGLPVAAAGRVCSRPGDRDPDDEHPVVALQPESELLGHPDAGAVLRRGRPARRPAAPADVAADAGGAGGAPSLTAEPRLGGHADVLVPVPHKERAGHGDQPPAGERAPGGAAAGEPGSAARPEPPDHALPAPAQLRAAWLAVQDEHHPLPLPQVGEGGVQQRRESLRRLHEPADRAAHRGWGERFRVAAQRLVPRRVDHDRPWLGPAGRPGHSVARLDDMQPDQRPGPVGQEPLPQRRELLDHQRHHRRSHARSLMNPAAQGKRMWDRHVVKVELTISLRQPELSSKRWFPTKVENDVATWTKLPRAPAIMARSSSAESGSRVSRTTTKTVTVAVLLGGAPWAVAVPAMTAGQMATSR